MKKYVIMLLFPMLLLGCSESEISESETDELSVTSASVDDIDSNAQDNKDTESVDETEDQTEDEQNYESKIDMGGQQAWEYYDDINEFMEASYENVMYEPTDAEALEEAIYTAFEEDTDEMTVTAKWSGHLMAFTRQMEDHFDASYIGELKELNEVIGNQGFEPNAIEVRSKVDQAREVRETQE